MPNSRKSAILWSVIAAAFVGPGTVATAARAGSESGLAYAPPLLGALLVGFLLMEMAARITLVTGRPLGDAVRSSLGSWAVYLLFGGILLGCCAYEAGNLLGGFAGVELFTSLRRWWVILPAFLAARALYDGDVKSIGRQLSLIVIVMGIVFLYAGGSAVFSDPAAAESNPLSTATTLAIFGTTIVPYNFMLAAGLGRGQSLNDMRSGLGISFLVGGLITLGVLLTGTVIPAFTDFEQLAQALEQQIGSSGRILLGVGLFAAGFSSAITAPFAAAMAGKTLFARSDSSEWRLQGSRFRLIWALVLAMGLIVAVLNLSIVPVILAAQFANALLLPFLAALVLYLANRRDLLQEQVNRNWQNAAGLVVFGYLTYKSGLGLLRLPVAAPAPWWLVTLVTMLCLALVYFMWMARKDQSS